MSPPTPDRVTPPARAQVKMLLTCEGVAVDSRNADEETALMHAAAGSHMSVVSELVKHGADTKAVDKHGKTPTDWVRSYWGALRVFSQCR